MNLQTCGIPLQLPHYHPRFPHHSLNNNSIFSPPTHSSNTNRIIKRTTKSPTLKCRHSAEYTEELQQQMLTTRPSPSPSPPQQQQQQDSFSHQQSSPLGGVGASPSRVYVGYSVYKGKAVLTITPKAPEFASLDSGAYKVSREGVALLQFAPAVGTRQYDWTRKQVFSLSVTEIGTLMGLGARDSCEFFHDPNKGKSEEGKVRKILKVEPLPDGSGHFFNLSVQNKLLNVDESIYIPISKAELTVIVSSFSFILPFLLGWHTFADSIKPEESVRFNNINSQIGTDVEWNR